MCHQATSASSILVKTPPSKGGLCLDFSLPEHKRMSLSVSIGHLYLQDGNPRQKVTLYYSRTMDICGLDYLPG